MRNFNDAALPTVNVNWIHDTTLFLSLLPLFSWGSFSFVLIHARFEVRTCAHGTFMGLYCLTEGFGHCEESRVLTVARIYGYPGARVLGYTRSLEIRGIRKHLNAWIFIQFKRDELSFSPATNLLVVKFPIIICLC